MNIYLTKYDFGGGGGVATLYYRIANWCKKNNILCEILFSKMSREQQDFLNKQNIRIKQIDANKNYEYLKKSASYLRNNAEEESIVLSTEFHDFVRLHDLLTEDINIKVLLYVVHPYSFNREHKGVKDKIVKLKNLLVRRPIIKKCLKENKFIFMDEYVLEVPCQYYGLKVLSKEAIVQRLPIEIIQEKNELIEKRNAGRYEEFNILTIARAEIPFKGYMLGLIRDFQKIAVNDTRLTLTIVTYGKDVNLLYNVLENCSEEVKNRIKIIGETSNDELEKFYYTANVYIGMGTTVLEAANYKLPVILVKDYSESFLTSGLFSKQPENNIASGKLFDGIELVQNILEMNDEEYILECEASKNGLIRYYGITNAILRIKQWKTRPQKIISGKLKLYCVVEEFFSHSRS